MDAIEVKALAFTRCRPCELRRLCAAYACGYRSHGHRPPSTADGSGARTIVPPLLWPRPVSRIRREVVQPLPPPSVRPSPPRYPSRGSTVCSSNECTAIRELVLLRRGALDVDRPRTLRAVGHLEFDSITLAQIGDALAIDSALVKEIVLARLTLDEPKALIHSQRPNFSCHVYLSDFPCVDLRRTSIG